MGWGARIAIGVAVLLVIGIAALVVYGGRVRPVQHAVEQTIPNDRFPN